MCIESSFPSGRVGGSRPVDEEAPLAAILALAFHIYSGSSERVLQIGQERWGCLCIVEYLVEITPDLLQSLLHNRILCRLGKGGGGITPTR